MKRGELKPATGGTGRKRVDKSAIATPSPLAKDHNLTRTAQQKTSVTSSEGKRVIDSPLASAPAVLATKSAASSEGKRNIGSPLALTGLAPRRGKVASVRPHQGVPFNVKPAPSPTKSSGMPKSLLVMLYSVMDLSTFLLVVLVVVVIWLSAGGRMVREPLSSQSPAHPLKSASAPNTPRRHRLLPLKPLNVLDVTVDPAR